MHFKAVLLGLCLLMPVACDSASGGSGAAGSSPVVAEGSSLVFSLPDAYVHPADARLNLPSTVNELMWHPLGKDLVLINASAVATGLPSFFVGDLSSGELTPYCPVAMPPVQSASGHAFWDVVDADLMIAGADGRILGCSAGGDATPAGAAAASLVGAETLSTPSALLSFRGGQVAFLDSLGAEATAPDLGGALIAGTKTAGRNEALLLLSRTGGDYAVVAIDGAGAVEERVTFTSSTAVEGVVLVSERAIATATEALVVTSPGGEVQRAPAPAAPFYGLVARHSDANLLVEALVGEHYATTPLRSFDIGAGAFVPGPNTPWGAVSVDCTRVTGSEEHFIEVDGEAFFQLDPCLGSFSVLGDGSCIFYDKNLPGAGGGCVDIASMVWARCGEWDFRYVYEGFTMLHSNSLVAPFFQQTATVEHEDGTVQALGFAAWIIGDDGDIIPVTDAGARFFPRGDSLDDILIS